MRLLHTKRLVLEQFVGSQIPEYVILSHTWGDDEVSYQDMHTRDDAPKRAGWAKVAGACALALRDGYAWIWIDTCCIDKASSSELQEAINSMYKWYQRANICYVYLADVPDRKAGRAADGEGAFARSRWFSRGWTLQELVAPGSVEFYAADWTLVGTKLERDDEIALITGIGVEVLQTCSLAGVCAAEKLSWASHRHATREEDMAYALLGIFNVNMPMLYGEGHHKAFKRLQEEILKRTEDHTLFLWNPWISDRGIGLLALDPSRFCRVERCDECPKHESACLKHDVRYSALRTLRPDEYSRCFESETRITSIPASLTSRGLLITIWILPIQKVKDIHNLLARDIGYDWQSSSDWQSRYNFSGVTHAGILNIQSANKRSMLCIQLSQNGEGDTFLRVNQGFFWLPIQQVQEAELRSIYVAQPEGIEYMIDLSEAGDRESYVSFLEVHSTSFMIKYIEKFRSGDLWLSSAYGFSRHALQISHTRGLDMEIGLILHSRSQYLPRLVVFLTFPYGQAFGCTIQVFTCFNKTDGLEEPYSLSAYYPPPSVVKLHKERVTIDLSDDQSIMLAVRRMEGVSSRVNQNYMRFCLQITTEQDGKSGGGQGDVLPAISESTVLNNNKHDIAFARSNATPGSSEGELVNGELDKNRQSWGNVTRKPPASPLQPPEGQPRSGSTRHLSHSPRPESSRRVQESIPRGSKKKDKLDHVVESKQWELPHRAQGSEWANEEKRHVYR